LLPEHVSFTPNRDSMWHCPLLLHSHALHPLSGAMWHLFANAFIKNPACGFREQDDLVQQGNNRSISCVVCAAVKGLVLTKLMQSLPWHKLRVAPGLEYLCHGRATLGETQGRTSAGARLSACILLPCNACSQARWQQLRLWI